MLSDEIYRGGKPSESLAVPLKGVSNHMAMEITSSSLDKHWTHQNPSTAAQASVDHNLRLLPFPTRPVIMFVTFSPCLTHLQLYFCAHLKRW